MFNKARELSARGGTCEVMREPLHPELKVPRLCCSEIGFVTHMTSTFQPFDKTHHWKFGEDVKGKPGWIIHLKKDSYEENSLSFNVVIGESRTLETTYLKSYTKVGVVAIMWKTPDGRFVSRHLINAFEEFGRTVDCTAQATS